VNVTDFVVVGVLAAGVVAVWLVRGYIDRHIIRDAVRRKAEQVRLRKIASWHRYALCVVLAILIAPYALDRLSILKWSPLSTPVVMFAASFVTIAVRHRDSQRRRRFFRSLRQRDQLVCPDCHGSLASCTQGALCPNCGYAFTPDSLTQDWADVKRAASFEVGESHRRARALERLRSISPWSPYYGHALLVVLLGWILLVCSEFATSRAMPWGTWVLVSVVLLFGLFIWDMSRRRDLIDRLEREKHLICPDCHYSLVAHATGGRCPECGYDFTPESLLQDWADVKVFYTFVAKYDWRDPE